MTWWKCRVNRGFLLLFCLALLNASPSFGMNEATLSQVCDDRTTILSHLANRYAEAPIALGKASNGGVIEVLTSNSGATFTIIITMPDGRAGSTDRRNTFSLTGLQALVQSFGGSSPSEGLAGPCIERVSNNCEYVRTVCAQIGSFREVLSK